MTPAKERLAKARAAVKTCPVLPKTKSGGLACEAKKAETFEEFERVYQREIKHGTYWHVTDNPCFRIDPKCGPRDMSAMAGGQCTPGKLMVTSHLEHWADYYSDQKNPRLYAAEIDMCAVPKKEYWQVNRGFGNEFWVDDPSKARVVRVLPVQDALKANARQAKKLPGSREELAAFWEKHRQKKSG